MSSVKRMIERSLLMSESRWLLNHRTHTADKTCRIWQGVSGVKFQGEIRGLRGTPHAHRQEHLLQEGEILIFVY